MTRTPPGQIAAAAALVLVFGALVPIRVDDADARSSSEECLTLSAKPPARDGAAIGVYARCLEIEPRDVVLMRDLGVLYEEAGDAVRAEEIYGRALRIDSKYAELHTRLGWLLLRKGDRGGARAEATRALALTLNASSALALRRAAE